MRRNLARRWRWAGVTLAALVVAPLALHLFDYLRYDLGPLFGGIAELEDRARGLAVKAARFEQATALRALGESRVNGFVVRFDDRLHQATFEAPAREGDAPAPTLLAIELDGPEPVGLEAVQGHCEVAGGALRLTYASGDSLATRGAFGIDPSTVGEIHVRLKSEIGREFVLGWAGEGPALNELAVSLFPVHGEFYTYRIRGEHLFRNLMREEDPFADPAIRKLTLRPSDVPGDRIEIDFVRLISKRSKYADPPFGGTYETLARETRRVVYANAPSTLRFEVDVPAQAVWLEVGLAVLESGAPVRFRVVARDGESAAELASEEMREPDAWRDLRLDLSAWAGRRLSLSFETACATSNVAFWSNPVLRGAPRERMHVVLLLEDAFRADRLSCAGYALPTTPAKDEWARSGALFTRAFSQETKTRPSCPALMTSLYPTATGVWDFDDVLSDSYVTLAEVLRSQGFDTAAFVQNPNAGPGAGLQQGFCSVLDKDAAGSRAEELYAAALAWLEARQDRNTFVYLHCIDPHAPYDPPAPYDAWHARATGGGASLKKNAYFDPEWVSEATREGRQALYAGEIAHNDACFGAFRERLAELGLERDTLLAFVSDHGEFLGEHGLWDHSPPGFAPVIRVPLAIAFPGRLPEGRRIVEPAQLIDVFPTVLELAGIPAEPLLLEGRSLVPLIRGEDARAWRDRVVVSDEVIDRRDRDDDRALASLIFRDWHVLRSDALERASRLPAFASARVFDLDDGVAEFDYLVVPHLDWILKYRLQGAVRDLQGQNRRIWRALTRGVSGSMEYDPRTVELLKELGYL